MPDRRRGEVARAILPVDGDREARARSRGGRNRRRRIEEDEDAHRVRRGTDLLIADEMRRQIPKATMPVHVLVPGTEVLSMATVVL